MNKIKIQTPVRLAVRGAKLGGEESSGSGAIPNSDFLEYMLCILRIPVRRS